jgi:hypothetical protein
MQSAEVLLQKRAINTVHHFAGKEETMHIVHRTTLAIAPIGAVSTSETSVNFTRLLGATSPKTVTFKLSAVRNSNLTNTVKNFGFPKRRGIPSASTEASGFSRTSLLK